MFMQCSALRHRFCSKTNQEKRQNRREMRTFFAKTSDFLGINLRTFDAKHRNFASKKSDVFTFPAAKP